MNTYLAHLRARTGRFGFACLLLFILGAVVAQGVQNNELVVQLPRPDPTSILADGARIRVEPPGINLTTLAQFPYTNKSPEIDQYTLTAYNGTNYIFWEWVSAEDKYNHKFNSPIFIKFPKFEGTNDNRISIFPRYISYVQDTDGDGMYDWWERGYKLEYRLFDDDGNPVYGNRGDNGRLGNADGDLLPGLGYPLGGDPCRLDLYIPKTDFPFNNFLEFAGFDGVYGTLDDPNTDPTVADTDNDGLPDGWEYYFWALRGAGAGSNALPWVTINPLTGGAGLNDDDGDGLRNIKEFEIGTDPTHCDTDRDGMDDKWELDNGLDPLNPCDYKENPDGDKMVQEGTLFHDEVYRRGVAGMEAGETAFDPRSGWDSACRSAHPNTVDYKNIDEYLGRDRIGRIQWDTDGHKVADASSDATNPQELDSDDDGIPDGWELYVGMNPNDDRDAGGDGDGDGLNNVTEWRNNSRRVWQCDGAGCERQRRRHVVDKQTLADGSGRDRGRNRLYAHQHRLCMAKRLDQERKRRALRRRARARLPSVLW